MDEKNYKTKIIREVLGEPTRIEVPVGHSAFVLTPDGELDLMLMPSEETLEPTEDGEDHVANEGMMRAMAVILCITDPEVNALVKRKLEQVENNGSN